MKALEVGEVNDPGKGITEKDIFTPGSAEDITVALEDTLLNSPTIAGSRFVHRIWEEEWQENVLLFQEKLDVISGTGRTLRASSVRGTSESNSTPSPRISWTSTRRGARLCARVQNTRRWWSSKRSRSPNGRGKSKWHLAPLSSRSSGTIRFVNNCQPAAA